MRLAKLLFWCLLSVIVIAAIWASFASNRLSSDQNSLIWATILCMVSASMAGGFSYLLFWCWRKRIAIIAGRYGGGREYSRDSQPVRYWSIMLLYLLVISVFIMGVFYCIVIMWTKAGGLRDVA
jgi:hypothetical protein